MEKNKKKKSERILFLGNGINLLFNSRDFSTKNIAKKSFQNVLPKEDFENNVSFQVLFEKIFCKKNSEGKVNINKCKCDLASTLANISTGSNPFLDDNKDFFSIYKKIITTNFDNEIDICLTGKKIDKNNFLNKKCLTGPVYSSGDLKVYHIHGSIEYPKTITIGLFKYQKVVSMILSAISKKIYKDSEIDKKNKDLLVKVLDGFYKKNKWFAFFLMDNITIDFLGFKLAREEFDVWCVLTLRAMLINSGIIKNNIINFHDIYIKEEEKNNEILFVKDVFNINYQGFLAENGNYKEKYQEIINSLKKEML